MTPDPTDHRSGFTGKPDRVTASGAYDLKTTNPEPPTKEHRDAALAALFTSAAPPGPLPAPLPPIKVKVQRRGNKYAHGTLRYHGWTQPANQRQRQQ